MREIETGDPRDKYKQRDVDEYTRGIMELHKGKSDDELREIQRVLCTHDLYYLGYFVLGIDSMHHEDVIDYSTGLIEKRIYRPFVFNRCREVQDDPDYHVDIWARGHFKSVIITELKTVQDILIDPNTTIGIYSYNATIARSFVAAVRAFLENPKLQMLFPDIIPSSDEIRAKKYEFRMKTGQTIRKPFTWSDESFSVKRSTSKKEDTVMGYGLVKGQAVSKHFDILVFDDCVTPDSVRTESSNAITTEQWKQALNTGSGENQRVRVIGTRYSFYDTYFHILNPDFAEGKMGGSRYKLRIHPCYAMGESGRVPVLRDRDYLENLEKTMVGIVWSAQQMCDPSQTSVMRFMDEWISERCDQDVMYKARDEYNWYIFVDPANTKNNTSDFTAMAVCGLGNDRKYYFVDGERDRLTQSERKEKLFALVNRWTKSTGEKPIVFEEQSGLLSDMEYFSNEMKRDNFYFQLKAVTTKPRVSVDARISGVPMKHQRIYALEPFFKNHRIVLAKSIFKVNTKGNSEDIMETFITQEYLPYPFASHDDWLDCMSRIADAETGVMLLFPDEKRVPRMIAKDSDFLALANLRDAYIPF